MEFRNVLCGALLDLWIVAIGSHALHDLCSNETISSLLMAYSAIALETIWLKGRSEIRPSAEPNPHQRRYEYVALIVTVSRG